MLYAAPKVEVAIYSTCKRISQKLLRNVVKFLNLIYDGLKVPKYKIIRENMEELCVNGPEGSQDIRTVCSYPSRVSTACLLPQFLVFLDFFFNLPPVHSWNFHQVTDTVRHCLL